MWLTFSYDDKPYLLNYEATENTLKVYLSNLKSLFHEDIQSGTVLERFQEMNPTMDVKVENAFNQILDLLSNVGSTTEPCVDGEENSVKLVLKSKISGFSIQFYCILSLTDDEKFLKEVTVPLINTVKYLEDQKQMLHDIIKQKDRELQEHKLEKGDISRTDLITEKFDESVLIQADSKSLFFNVFHRDKPFWTLLTDKFGQFQFNIPKISPAPWNNIKRKRKVYSAETSKKGIFYK